MHEHDFVEDGVIVRQVRTGEEEAVRAVVEKAFDNSPQTPRLVELMRRRGKILLSFIAEYDQKIVGMIMFHPSLLVDGSNKQRVLMLAPLAVLPEFQRRGIGTRLTRHAIAALQADKWEIAFVVGRRRFYPRFGFQPAEPLGFQHESGRMGAPFMVLELIPGALRKYKGTLVSPPEYKEVGL